MVTRDILTKFSCLVFLCSLGKPWPLSSWAQIQSIRRLGENSQGRIRKSFLAESGRIGESDNFIKFKIKTFLVPALCCHQGRYVRLYTRRRTRSYRKLQSQSKKTRQIAADMTWGVKKQNRDDLNPCRWWSHCWGCPKKMTGRPLLQKRTACGNML